MKRIYLSILLLTRCNAYSLEQAQSLIDQEQFTQAIALLNKLHEKDPHNVHCLNSLGFAHTKIGNLNEAVQAYHLIYKQNPQIISALYNMAYAFKNAGHHEKAQMILRHILQLKPDYEKAHLSLAFSLIQSGNIQEGFEEHIWNLKYQGKYPEQLHKWIQNRSLKGKRIYVIPEGGLGDSINFFRYLKYLKDAGAYTIVRVQEPLIQLFKTHEWIDELVQNYTPAYDDRVTFMSLPMLFSDYQTLGSELVPYIKPDKTLVQKWAIDLKKDKKLKVGICWQASAHNDQSRIPVARRGIPFKEIIPLLSLDHCSFYSLQRKDGLEQLKNFPHIPLHIFPDSFDEEHGAFVDTCAVIQGLDLIITVDTSVAHLAGALGKETWLLLPYVADWRFLSHRTDSPWYPTMKIFQQPKPFDWQGVIRDVCKKLSN